MIDAGKGSKGIALACGVCLAVEESCDKLCRIWNKRLGMRINRGDGKDGVLANVGVAVLETGAC